MKIKSPISYVIAELGLNHNGNIDLCKRMFLEAKKAGCNAVKLQSLYWNSTTTEKNLNVKIQLSEKKNVILGDYLKEIVLSKKNHEVLRKYAKKIGIDIISTPLDDSHVDLLKKLNFDKIKIASQDINNLTLIEKSAKTGLPIIISTGMSDLSEIIEAVECIEKYNNKVVTILHCVSKYPTKSRELNMRRIKTLRKIFENHIIGFSDHTLGYDAAIIARSLGASTFEKHFTFDKNAEGFDHAISADMNDMKVYCNKIKQAYYSMGESNYKKIVDIAMRKNMRRSIVAKKNLKVGEIINWNSIDFKRPYGGINPSEAKNIIGRKLKKNIKKDTLLTLNDFS